MVRPGTRAPELKVETVSDEVWDLHKINPEKFQMIVFYRGIHCPVCKKYLKDLSGLSKQFNKQGVLEILAVSGDSSEKAYKAKEEWGLSNIEVGFDQSLESMRDWSLYISESIKSSEPKYFAEPGLFIIDKDHKVFYSAITSMPFGRPNLGDMLEALSFINQESYPARGTISYNSVM